MRRQIKFITTGITQFIEECANGHPTIFFQQDKCPICFNLPFTVSSNPPVSIPQIREDMDSIIRCQRKQD